MSVVISVLGRLFGGVLFRNRTTAAITGVLIVGLALFVWHKLDKGSAVRAAVSEYVAAAEITALKAQIAEANRLAQVASEAAQRLDERAQAVEGEAVRLAAEIKQYEAENALPTSCRLSPDLARRLRGN
ncbi:MAG: hypothetical protein CSA68_07515 [Rhodobacterales bacterium]|nr:MAG: hypothetical protein CSA68_07515 [Rhodobacterales bacterium]